MLIVIESTVPSGTTSWLIRGILEKGFGLRVEDQFYLADVPERIAPGRAIEELLHAPRVVGGVGPQSTKRAMEVYSKINTNLLAAIAERLGIDVYKAIKLANTHPRVNIHLSGAGVLFDEGPLYACCTFGGLLGCKSDKARKEAERPYASPHGGTSEEGL